MNELADLITKKLFPPQQLLQGFSFLEPKDKNSFIATDFYYCPLFYHFAKLFNPKSIFTFPVNIALVPFCIAKGAFSTIKSVQGCQPKQKDFTFRIAKKNILSVRNDVNVNFIQSDNLYSCDQTKTDVVYSNLTNDLGWLWNKTGRFLILDNIDKQILTDFAGKIRRDFFTFKTRNLIAVFEK